MTHERRRLLGFVALELQGLGRSLGAIAAEMGLSVREIGRCIAAAREEPEDVGPEMTIDGKRGRKKGLHPEAIGWLARSLHDQDHLDWVTVLIAMREHGIENVVQLGACIRTTLKPGETVWLSMNHPISKPEDPS